MGRKGDGVMERKSDQTKERWGEILSFLSHLTGSFVISSFTVLQMPSGLLSFNSSGNSASGKFWKQSGRTNLRIPSAPTEVNLLSVVAGNGLPWCMAVHKETTVGTPFNISLPKIFSIVTIFEVLSAISFSVVINVLINCPSVFAIICSNSSLFSHFTIRE